MLELAVRIGSARPHSKHVCTNELLTLKLVAQIIAQRMGGAKTQNTNCWLWSALCSCLRIGAHPPMHFTGMSSCFSYPASTLRCTRCWGKSPIAHHGLLLWVAPVDILAKASRLLMRSVLLALAWLPWKLSANQSCAMASMFCMASSGSMVLETIRKFSHDECWILWMSECVYMFLCMYTYIFTHIHSVIFVDRQIYACVFHIEPYIPI